jgi:hypothetical protein
VEKSIFDVRRENLDSLIKEKFEGNRSAFARAAGKNINLINMSMTSNAEVRKPIGERLAREIEEAMLLPSGWLDADRGRGSAKPVVGLQRMRGDKRTDADIFPEQMVVGDAWLKTVTERPVEVLHHQSGVFLVDTTERNLERAGVYVIHDAGQLTPHHLSPLPAGKVALSLPYAGGATELVLQRKQLDIAGRVVARLSIEKL